MMLSQYGDLTLKISFWLLHPVSGTSLGRALTMEAKCISIKELLNSGSCDLSFTEYRCLTISKMDLIVWSQYLDVATSQLAFH